MDIVSYHSEFRTALFLSSLTLGTFLFTMKSFIIQTIKKEIYDHTRHKANAEQLAADSKSSPIYYRGLKNLSRLIYWSIIAALSNALIQITVGYFQFTLAAIFCLGSSILSWGLVAFVLYQVGKNMEEMLNYAEADANDEKKKQNKAN